jgi:hypothetical protein
MAMKSLHYLNRQTVLLTLKQERRKVLIQLNPKNLNNTLTHDKKNNFISAHYPGILQGKGGI